MITASDLELRAGSRILLSEATLRVQPGDRIGLVGRNGLPRPVITARLGRNINSAPGRRDLIRVHLSKKDDGWTAEPVLGKSGAITTLSRAHGWFIIDEDSQGLARGTTIEVTLYL